MVLPLFVITLNKIWDEYSHRIHKLDNEIIKQIRMIMYSNNKILINYRDDDCQNQLHIKTDTAYNILVAIDEGAHVFEIGVNDPSDLYF